MSEEEVVQSQITPQVETEAGSPGPSLKRKKKSGAESNPMRNVGIEKVVVNIGVGEAGEKLQKAEKVLEMVTEAKPIRTISKTTNKDLGIRKYMPIGCKVTLRRDAAEKFLEKAFWVKDNRIAYYSFDDYGNFSFGIPDYTEFQGMKYDPNIGIFGMDVNVILNRPGQRISRRRRMRKKYPQKHRVTELESKEYLKRKFNVEVVEE